VARTWGVTTSAGEEKKRAKIKYTVKIVERRKGKVSGKKKKRPGNKCKNRSKRTKGEAPGSTNEPSSKTGRGET